MKNSDATSVAIMTQRTQYPSIKEYTLSYRGLNNMIEGIFRIQGTLGSLGAVCGHPLLEDSSSTLAGPWRGPHPPCSFSPRAVEVETFVGGQDSMGRGGG